MTSTARPDGAYRADRADATAPARPPGQAPDRAPRPGFRPEVEGLRALASLLVVVYHVWVGRVSGGVDVFFVLSGFLAAGQLTRAAEHGTLDVVARWGRTLRRLLPATAVVLLGTMVASLVWLPPSRWPQTLREVAASTVFAENWRLAADAVDYYAARDAASVVQHFWSLSIQGQFALLFPVAVLAAVALGRRAGSSPRTAVLVLVAVVTATSFVYGVVLTASDQQLAYFHSGTRLWELTAGALLALAVDRLRPALGLRVVLGWLGVAGLVVCGLVLDVEGGFPGYLALWPVLCAAAVLVAGTSGHPAAADQLLAAPAAQYLGRISFPLYLWHWPVLLLALQATHREEPGPLLGAAIILTSLVLAAATEALVERPLGRLAARRPGRAHGYRVAVAALVPVLVVALGWQALTTVLATPQGRLGDPDHPGAAIRQPGFAYRGATPAELLPPAVASYDDWVYYKDAGSGCTWEPYPVLEQCTYVDAPDPAAPAIVLIGDSHMQQFLPAVAPVARERGWRVLTLIRGNCPFSTGSETTGEPECAATNQAAIEHVRATRPALVIADASRNVRRGLTETTPPGFVAAWQAVGAAGVPVLAVRDNPRFDAAPASCIDTWGRGAAKCLVPRDDLYAPTLAVPPGGLPANTSVLDLSDSICDDRWCPPEMGNVLVYLDDNHLTATFSASLAPVVGPRVAALVDR
ncbi:acyltransferase family protein [Actinomycetospora chlora]|uniref:Acyltransferase family protein n=1 Tax=Actinomycetospora chlora TaxID=663608 RepID=A0ABP9C522_9PSEU